MAVHKFGKYRGDEQSSTEERIWERFANLKKRLLDSSFGRSFVIEEKGARMEVPVPHAGGPAPAPASPGPAERPLVLEDVFGHPSAACSSPPRGAHTHTGHSGHADRQAQNSNLASASSSPVRAPAILELHSDLLGFSSEAAPGESTLGACARHCAVPPAEDAPARRGALGGKHGPGSAFETELRALDEYYARERQRIHAKYGHLAADRDAAADTTQARKRRRARGAAGPAAEHLLHGRSINAAPAAFAPEELRRALGLRIVGFDSLAVRPVKVAEASFSEVFRVGNHIYKIIPFNDGYLPATFFKETAAMAAMRHERGVIGLVDAFILRGAYAPAFMDAWNAFPDPENPSPACYGHEQEYGCVVMEEGGRDLESYEFETSQQIVAFLAELAGIVHSLETKFLFEHRDLHWGNILISDAGVSIIDYSFSRLEFSIDAIAGAFTDVPAAQVPVRGAGTVYTDLEKEEWLFAGDDAVDEQFRIYRLMRASAGGDWQAFNPSSNGLWIGYVIGKLMLKARTLGAPVEQRKTLRLLQRIRSQFELRGWGADFVALLADMLRRGPRARRAKKPAAGRS